ncbi:MAG: hypothetical protein ABSB19_02630 [Methylomonas sp.]|jgi:hypothetical protein
MLSLKIEYDVPEDRSLHIQLPQNIKPGKHEFVLVMDSEAINQAFSPSEQFKELIGSLSWTEEPLAYQRRMRDEWQ